MGGRIIRWPAPILALIVGVFSAFAVLLVSAEKDPILGGPRLTRLENVIVEPHPIVWGLLYMIGPPTLPIDPRGGHLGFGIWLGGWGLVFGGLIWLGKRALEKADKLEARAEKDDDILTADEPTWLSLDTIVKMQGLQAGSGNTIHIIQQINKMINQPDVDKNWWLLPAGIILLGVISAVIAAAITKMLGLT